MDEKTEAPQSPRAAILVVDDESAIRKLCERILSSLGFSVRTADNGEQALSRLKESPADIVLTDLSMPVMDGVRLTEEIRRCHPGTDVIVMTAYPRLETAIPLLRSGAYDYLIKPFDAEVLSAVVDRCFQKRSLSNDLSREKVLRAELEAAYHELQKVEKMKEAFLSRVNHELRTPLAPAVLALESLEKEVTSPTARRMLHTAEANLARLQEILENLLIFAELRRQDFTSYATGVDLGSMLEALVARFRTLAEEKDVRVELTLAGDAREAWGAPKLLETAFKHLLLNAIQFNRRGGVVRVKTSQSGGRIHVFFEDTGIGVPDSQRDRIFDSFYQVAEYLTREVGGLGLGLAIVRRVAEAHGGTVSVSSDGKSGSVFRFELPYRQPFVDRLLATIHKTPNKPGEI